MVDKPSTDFGWEKPWNPLAGWPGRTTGLSPTHTPIFQCHDQAFTRKITFVGGLTWSCNCRREREHVTHSCPAAEDLELSRRNLILEGDFRALQAILLGFSALVAGLTGEMASLVDFGQSALNREGA